MRPACGLLAIVPALFLAPPGRGAPVPPSPKSNSDRHARLALAFQSSVNDYNRPYIRFVSYWDVEDPPEKDAPSLWDWVRYQGFWFNQMSFEGLKVPLEVPGGDGRLYWFDLRWYGWNARAWRAVAERDPFTREPWAFHTPAEALRLGAGYAGVKPVKGADGLETTPLLAMVNGPWLIRDTLETARSPSYYDLLFARFRYPSEEGRVTEKEAYKDVEIKRVRKLFYNRQTGSNYYAEVDEPTEVTKYRDVVKVVKNAAFVDFPRDIDDWERAFGIDKVRAYAKETTIDLDFGAVVLGGEDFPGIGSIVARNNRLIVIVRGIAGKKHMRSYDTDKTSGDTDYGEKLIFKNGRFKKGDGADAVFKAGEILSDLPNGGQAGLLINGQGKRVERAGQEIASDRHVGKKGLGAGVENYKDCMCCHSGGGGFVPPKDQVKDDVAVGIKQKFKDAEQQSRFEAFFREWEDEIAEESKSYHRMVAKTTAHPQLLPLFGGEKSTPWNGSTIAAMTLKLVEDVDAPVTPERAGRKLGVPADMVKYLAHFGGVSADGKIRNTNLQRLKQGKAIAYKTFEEDVFRQLGFLLDAKRLDPEFKKLLDK